MTLRTCIQCGDLAEGTRCASCQTERDRLVDQSRGSSTARGYDRKWQAKSSRAIRRQPACAVCGTTEDLSSDHVVPKAAGGTDDLSNLVTLCRRHNSSKGARA